MTGLGKRSAADYAFERCPVMEMADTAENGTMAAAGQRQSKDYEQPRRKDTCGWGSVRPECCQTFLKPAWFLVCLSWAGAVQGIVVNGFVNVVISTVERRFEISSTESGTIASCYDIAAVLCLIPVSYFGGGGRKPVYLSIGMLTMAVGSFVFALPHFTTDLYEVGQTNGSTCSGVNGTTCAGSGLSSLSNYKFVFFLGQLLHGAGASPLYTLGTTYLDDNLSVASASLYQGIFYAFAILGPGIGYVAGGVFLDIFTDFDKIDTSNLSINKNNPRWVGAWWVGFLISGAMAFLISVPFFGFPKQLPGAEKYRAEKEKEVYRSKGKESKESDHQPLGPRHILTSFKIIVTNPPFMFLSFAAAASGVFVSGFSTFTPKFIEYQFSITSSAAAQYVGLVAIPAGGGATFLGGWLVKRFKLNVFKILLLCIITTAITECLLLVFIIHCTNVPFAGISTQYQQPGSVIDDTSAIQLEASCNAGCGCSTLDYNPVCGRDDVMYYSPCYAGCSMSFAGDEMKYTNCSCVMYNYTAQDIADSQLWMAQAGRCTSDCPYLPVLLAMFSVIIVGTFLTSMPALAASLRCVTQEHRSFALGIQWIIARCLGSIPGPILFGKIIDITCIMWQNSCKGDGACFYYDNKQMSRNLLGVGMAANMMSVIFFSLACFFYHSRSQSKNSTAADDTASNHTSMSTISPPTPVTENPVNSVVTPTPGTENSANSVSN